MRDDGLVLCLAFLACLRTTGSVRPEEVDTSLSRNLTSISSRIQKNPTKDNATLPPWAILLIVTVVFLVLATFIVALCVCMKRHKKNRTEPTSGSNLDLRAVKSTSAEDANENPHPSLIASKESIVMTEMVEIENQQDDTWGSTIASEGTKFENSEMLDVSPQNYTWEPSRLVKSSRKEGELQ